MKLMSQTLAILVGGSLIDNFMLHNLALYLLYITHISRSKALLLILAVII